MTHLERTGGAVKIVLLINTPTASVYLAVKEPSVSPCRLRCGIQVTYYLAVASSQGSSKATNAQASTHARRFHQTCRRD